VTEAVVNAPPDGYTLLLVNAANAINATLYDNLSFNFIRDIAAVASITRESLVMALHPSVPAKTVSELIAYAKANPGKLRMGSGGNGSTSHVAGELFKMMTGVNMVHVPYRSIGLAFAGLIGGQVQVAFGGMTASSEHIKTGKLLLLAVTTAMGSEALPDIPTIGNFVPGYETSNWFGIGTPRNTPVGIIERLNREINAGLADPRLKARLTDTGATVYAGLPADFEKFMSEEAEKWGKVVRAANIKPE
jgi:tripartite-type tricarboxylate transporter receptor subunit TctC